MRLAGRLDGESAEQLSETLDRLLREGQRSVLLDMGDVTYLSSPGTQVLNRMQQEFASLRGELRVGAPSPVVLDALSLAELKSKLVVAGGDSETIHRMRASTALRAMDLTRDAWRSPISLPFRGSYEVTCRDPGGALACRVYEKPARVVPFPETAFGLGVGALGAATGDCAARFGELVAAAGAVVYLPTEGGQVPDFDLGLGGRPPTAVLASGLVCDGEFSQLARFSTQPDAEAVPLGELARVCLDAVGGDTVGIVMLAETAGLVGAWLRRSPGAEGAGIVFDVEGIREWLGTTPEPAHEGTAALVVGVASRAPDPALAPALRPLGDSPGLVGHFHAVAFTYRPVPQRTVALRVLVTKLFTQQRVRGLLHLLSDDRGGAGAGESNFRRGLCWAAPVTRVVTAA
ncbi:MAG TPA: STAS domain-containing protein [Gemmatimonadales bacterium]|nr:STAS domain-containing protein [Gemmatimonadales bacterium]